mgnify:CR=1 FL=1
MLWITNRNKGKIDSEGKPKPANWEYRFDAATVNGKRKRISKMGFRTKKEAEVAGLAALKEYNESGQVFSPSEMSVSDYFDLWLEKYCAVNLKATTYESYKKRVENHIKPVIGNYKLKAIQPITLQELINNEFNNGTSRHSLVSLKALLTGAFGYAVIPLNYIQSNPAMFIKLPLVRAKAKTETRKKERRAVTDEEWKKIMARFPEGHPSHLPLMLAYHCGFRLGEVFALTWDNIDFEHNGIFVENQVQFDSKSSRWYFCPPKYDSRRFVQINSTTKGILEKEKERQQSNREEYGEYYKELYVDDVFLTDTKAPTCRKIEMVMRREDGSYLQPRTMQNVGRVIHGATGEPCISAEYDFHSLRHTHATKLTEMGVPMAVIQERLGHAKIEMTEHYADHVTEKMREDLQNKLENVDT